MASDIPLHGYHRETKADTKRGFETKREAVAWEHEMMLKSQAKLDMTFGSFYEIYEADKASRLKQSTWETKVIS